MVVEILLSQLSSAQLRTGRGKDVIPSRPFLNSSNLSILAAFFAFLARFLIREAVDEVTAISPSGTWKFPFFDRRELIHSLYSSIETVSVSERSEVLYVSRISE